MNEKNYFTDGTSIFRFEGFDRIAVLKNYETGEIVKVPWPADGMPEGYVFISLPIPPQNKTQSTDKLSPKEQEKHELKSSRYYGVSFHKRSGRWRVQISRNDGSGKKIYGGLFKTEFEAAKKADEILEKHNLKKKNFPS